MGPKVLRVLALVSAVVVVVVLLVLVRTPARGPVTPERKPPPKPYFSVSGPVPNLETSLRGPLQEMLQAAYPNSFREGVDIFFEARNGWVSDEVFEWWALRVDPEGLTREGAERMFSRISDETPVFPDSRKRQICAVVGASGNLLGSRYGPLIDAHDLVIRINRAPTDAFDSDVGRRTTHHVAWPTNLHPELADRRAVLLWNPLTLHTPDLFDRMLSIAEEEMGWDLARVRIIHPEFVKYLHEDWMKEQGQLPSTGFIAMMLAAHVCDEVDVFGFGADALGRWDRYYEDDPAIPTDLHPADFEGEFRREMEANGILKVYLGNRSADGVEFPGFRDDETED
jgi:hypothetical protein